MASEIKVDTISEKTSANGVTIDSLSIKDGGLVAAGNIDVNGNNLVLDANANTYLDAGTDDTIKVYVSGAEDLRIAANAINVLSGTTLTIDSGATITNSGTANGFGSADPSSADGDTLGTASAEWSDLYLADSSVIYFGNDQDTTLTHTDGTGLTLNSTNKLCFNDASQFIQGSSNAILSLGATDEIDLTATAVDLNGTLDVSGTVQLNDSTTIIDDKGLVFGTDGDWFLGPIAGEASLAINKGSTQGPSSTEGQIEFLVGDSGDTSYKVQGGEGGDAVIYFYSDQADDNADLSVIFGDQGGGTQGLFMGVHYDGLWDNEFQVTDDAIIAEHEITVTGVDYAELFEWKTQLADAAAVTDAYGLTVVLDGDKVRLAEEGEEADVLGVVRPSKSSAVIGGNGIYWHNKKLKNVWGEEQKEGYIQVNWHNLNEHGNSIKHYMFMKDRIPQYELIDQPKQDVPNWHLLDSNFKRDEFGNKIALVVPSTAEEKLAHRYTERSTIKNTDIPLKRRIINPDYNSDLTYVKRFDRRTEWCVVGLLGQVPVRDTAIIPTHWKLMKNLESGIDLYFIK